MIPRPPRLHPASFALGAVALALVARAHALYMRPTVWLNLDEGYAAALASRLLDTGGLPYVAGVSQRGPVMYWIYEIALALGGRSNVSAIRWGGLVSSLAAVLAGWWYVRLLDTPLAAGLASLMATWWLTAYWSPFNGLAWNGELIALPFLLISLALATRGICQPSSRTSRLAFLASGIAAALAVFSKQSFLGHAVVSLVWLALDAPPTARARRAWAYSLGFLLVTCGVLTPYLLTHQLATFWYYFVTWGKEVYMAPVTSADIVQVLRDGVMCRIPFVLALTLGAWGCWRKARTEISRSGSWSTGLRWVVPIAQLLVAIPSATFTGRDFGHYFLPADCFASVAAAVSLQELGRRWLSSTRPAWPSWLVACLFLVGTWLGQNRHRQHFSSMPWYAQLLPDNEALGAWVRSNTSADDALFVWGFRGDVYLNARRRPASRFVYSLYPSGVVPWYQEPIAAQMQRVAPGSQQTLIDELEEARAEIVLDAGGSLMGRYMIEYPDLQHYLQTNFCLAEVLHHPPVFNPNAGVQVVPAYRRRKDEKPCRAIPSAPTARTPLPG